ncbi:MAG: hypothetical protein ACUVWR_18990 [Anaerolineae bacterium]
MSLLTIMTVASLAGYFCFLLLYPSIGKGDTIKATYQLQVFPFLAMLGGDVAAYLRGRCARAYFVIMIALTIVFAHNLPVLITRFSPFAARLPF